MSSCGDSVQAFACGGDIKGGGKKSENVGVSGWQDLKDELEAR